MTVTVDVQVADPGESVPTKQQLIAWARAALSHRQEDAELSIRVVGETESTDLNHRYRARQCPTNVLSFPADIPAGIPVALIGDIVICRSVVEREAAEQDKPVESHWAHMVIHGALHLLGYDHQNDEQAAAMENLEVQILRRLGYADPYVTGDRGSPSAQAPVR
jgi:probable rRNA maturation factor